jgi:hypothetical protein
VAGGHAPVRPGPDQLVSLDRITLGTFAGPAGTFRQRTEITSTQRAIRAKLELADPPGSTSSPQLAQPPDQREHLRLDTRR